MSKKSYGELADWYYDDETYAIPMLIKGRKFRDSQ
jgi:hypothetical protein